MNDTVYKAIGNEIRSARARIRMSQSDLASAIGVNVTTITNYENARRAVSVDMLYRIATALSCEPTDFMPSVKAFEVTRNGN